MSDGPKRVALFLPNLAGGGAERVALAQARELVRRGHQVDIVLIFGGGELLPLVPPEVNVVEFKARRMSAALRPLVRYLRTAQPFTLEAFMWPSTVIALAARLVARSRTRIVVNDQIALTRQYDHGRALAALKVTARIFYPMADARIVCSSAAADDIAQLSQVPRSRFEVIYNPIEPPPVVATTPEVERLWGDAEQRVITVGSLKEQKNHELLLRAFARLDRPGARLMLVGEGHLRPRLEELRDSLGLSDRVIFAGFHLDPWPFYASADLFVLSSDYEGFANVVAEALYAGLPVVSTDCVAGPGEILDGGRFGRLVPVGSEAGLARAMAEALDDSSDSPVGRQRALDISGPHVVNRYMELLLGG